MVARDIDGDRNRFELEGLPVTSLPPTFFEYEAWRTILVNGCDGISGLAEFAKLPNLESLAVMRSGLTETPRVWPATVYGLSLDNNELEEWPKTWAKPPL